SSASDAGSGFLGLVLPVARRLLHGRVEVVDLERLPEESEAEPAAVTVEIRSRGGQHNDADRRVTVPHVFHQLQTGAAGHRVVGQHEIVALLFEEPEAFGSARGDVGLAAPDREQLAQETPDVSLVVDDQAARGVQNCRARWASERGEIYDEP